MDMPDGRLEVLKAHQAEVFAKSTVGHDHHTHGNLFHHMRHVYYTPERDGPIIDGGGYRGEFVNDVITAYGRVDYRRYEKEYIPKLKPELQNYSWRADRCPPEETPAVSIYSFEPTARAYEHLRERAKIFGWANEQFSLVRAALADKSGKLDMYSSQDILDPKASLDSKIGNGRTAHEEKGVSLDTFIKKSVPAKKAFLARLSINGYEMKALQGAKKSLANRKLRYTLWEYSPMWAQTGYNLKDAIDLHWEAGYLCNAMLAEPVVITESLFPEDLSKLPNRFYVLCGYGHDNGVRTMLKPMGKVDYYAHTVRPYRFQEQR